MWRCNGRSLRTSTTGAGVGTAGGKGCVMQCAHLSAGGSMPTTVGRNNTKKREREREREREKGRKRWMNITATLQHYIRSCLQVLPSLWHEGICSMSIAYGQCFARGRAHTINSQGSCQARHTQRKAHGTCSFLLPTSYTPVKMDMTLLSTAAQMLAMWTNGP